ncbi:MAG: cytochrome P460 family protein [Deltaproteobacteria bacterium]|nr:cytochrome P460 family protein [Deltaproteobacteria bacterium]
MTANPTVSWSRLLLTSAVVLAIALPMALFPAPSLLSQPASSSAEVSWQEPMAQQSQGELPAYDDQGSLLLPTGFERWPLVGTSVGLGYSERTSNRELFHNTFLEPASYDHFQRTGEFREGTMLALVLRGPGEGIAPQQRGRFASEVVAVELAVKDSSRSPQGWAYYDFGNGTASDGSRPRAESFQAGSCYGCHAEHAVHDNVFLQFYPVLTAGAPSGSRFESTQARLAAQESQEEEPAERTASRPRRALQGYDPVLLTEGKEERGEQDITAVADGYLYRFVSEENRERFLSDPQRFGIQNEECPMVPGARAQPDLFAVHHQKIYIFASEGCIEDFLGDPDRFVGGSSEADPPAEDAPSKKA